MKYKGSDTLEEHKEKQRKFSKYSDQMKTNPTPAELAVKAALDELGIQYRFQKGFLRMKTLRIVDFYVKLPRPGGRSRIALEIDGKHHEYHDQMEYDIYRESELRAQRKTIRIVRVMNEWVFAQKNLPKALGKVLNAVRDQKGQIPTTYIGYKYK